MPKPLPDKGINVLFIIFIHLPVFFAVCSIFVPAYVGLVGNLLNTMIAMFWIPLPAKSKSDHRATEHGKYLVGLINST